MKRRDANLTLVALGALGGGVVVVSLPVELLERAVAAAGLSALVPQAAPPLGSTAQIMLAGAGALLCALIVAICLPWRGKREDGRRFWWSRLLTRRGARAGTASLEYYPTMDDLNAAPVPNRMDAHPDAPPRPPLFARRDLGEAVLPAIGDGNDSEVRQDNGENRPAGSVRDITGLSMPSAPEPLPWDLIEQEMGRVLKGIRLSGQDEAEGGDSPDAPAAVPSLSQLADRLEKGLARRRMRLSGNSDDPVQAGESSERWTHEGEVSAAEAGNADPAPHAGDGRGPDRSDEDLERALAALKTITQRAG